MNRQYIGEENGEIVLHKKEITLIPEFKILFDRDKGSINDLKGRHQLVACGEMKFIYYHNDPRSEFFNTPLSACKETLMDLCTLPANWKIDKAFDAAVARYKKLQVLSSAGNAYFAADAALYDRGDDVKELTDIIRDIKSELRAVLKTRTKNVKDFKPEDFELIAKVMSKIEGILSIQTNIDKLINGMPKLTNTIKELREQYAQEDNEQQIVVGDRQLGNRED